MWAKADGVPVDEDALARRVATAVQEVVDRQRDAGITVVNDGEMSKPSYATYVKDRLHGFGGESVQQYFFADLADFPRSAEIVAANPGRRKRTAPACNGEISVNDLEAVEVDIANLRRALGPASETETFMSAASPGVISLFFGNDYYPSDEEYVFAIADAMHHEYAAIAAAGITLQLDCPDLAMGRHSAYAHDGHRRVPSPRRHEHRGAQPRGARHPRRSAAHAPLLGQLPRAAPPRCRSGRHPRSRVAGRAADDPVRGRQPPSRARVVVCSRTRTCPTTRSSAPA